MGLFGSGGGTLGLGGTKYDPTTYGGTTGDIAGGIQDAGETITEGAKGFYDEAGNWVANLYDDAGIFIGEMGQGDWTGWTDHGKMIAEMQGFADPTLVPDWLKDMWGKGEQAFYEAIDTGSEVAGDTLGDDPVGDLKDAAGDAEDKINANIADINEDIETGIDENTDTLNQMEDTINSNVADANVALGNLQAVVNDTSTIINQGLDASININNPNSLITNPQGWYDANIEGLRQGPGKVWYDWATGKDEDAIIEHAATNVGNLFVDYGEGLGNMFGGLIDHAFDWSDDGASDELRNRRRPTNAGDPFGLEGTSRRLVESQDTFQSRQNRKAQMAPSMINKGNYA